MTFQSYLTYCLQYWPQRTDKGSDVDHWIMQIRCHFWECIKYCCLFHHRTRSAYVYNGCLAWHNVVLTPRIHSSVKYNTVNWGKVLTSVMSAINQHTHYRPTCTRNRNDKRQEINTYPNWLYCMLEWYVELTICHTTPDIHWTQLYSLTTCMTTKATFCQLPTTYCLLPLPALQLKYATRM